jgi:MFS family permease
VFLPLFVLRERRARRPIVELGLFANPIYARGVLALLAHFQAWNAVGFLLPFAMIDGLGYSATKAGSILAVFSLVRSIASPVAGWLADRIDYRIPMGLGMGLMAGSLILLSRLTLDVAQWQLIAVLAVASVGSALFDPSNSASMMGTVPPARLGLAGATIATARQIGLSIGIALAGAVLAARKAHHLTVLAPTGEATSGAAANALMAGTGDALLVSAVICALGILPIVFWGGRSIPAAASPSDPQRE